MIDEFDEELRELKREIIETRGPDGSPPFLVRWADEGRTTLVFPGPDARVHSLAKAEG